MIKGGVDGAIESCLADNTIDGEFQRKWVFGCKMNPSEIAPMNMSGRDVTIEVDPMSTTLVGVKLDS